MRPPRRSTVLAAALCALLAACSDALPEPERQRLVAAAAAAPEGARASLLLHALATLARGERGLFYSAPLTTAGDAFWRAPPPERAATLALAAPAALAALGCAPALDAPDGATAARACPAHGPRLIVPEAAAAAGAPAVVLAALLEADARDRGLSAAPLHHALRDALLTPSDRPSAPPPAADAPAGGPSAPAAPPGPAPAVRVTLTEALAADGAPAGETARTVLRRGSRGLAACFAHRVQCVPDLPRVARLALTLDREGAVTSASSLGPLAADAPFAACAEERARALRFPAPQPGADPVTLTATFTFALAPP